MWSGDQSPVRLTNQTSQVLFTYFAYKRPVLFSEEPWERVSLNGAELFQVDVEYGQHCIFYIISK
jgi:hypothetical protein